MRTSRLSKETSALFKMANQTAAPSSPPRRTTRSSLARFAYAADTSTTTTTAAADSAIRDLVLGDDIEDAVTTSTSTSASKKRRRAATSTTETEPDVKTEQTETETVAGATRRAPAAKKARKPARVIKGQDAARVEPPSDWAEVYDVVREMRLAGAARDAAVDTMGCERLFHPEASPRDRRFHILVALMLSSQTKDTVNAVAMRRLMTELPAWREGAEAGLCLENVLAVEPARLNELIWAVGFHNNKTKYIKATAEILRDRFDGDVPDTVEGLTSLPGVGPKMAYLCLSAAWDKTEGIGVDVHVHRITNLWGWHKTTQPEGTRAALQGWLPRDKWREINWLLVGLGQTVCLPVGRKCGDCELGARGLCKAADRKKVNEGRRTREVKVEVGEDLVIKTEEEEEVVKDEVVNESVEPKSAPVQEVKPEESEPTSAAAAAGAPRRRRGKGA